MTIPTILIAISQLKFLQKQSKYEKGRRPKLVRRLPFFIKDLLINNTSLRSPSITAYEHEPALWEQESRHDILPPIVRNGFSHLYRDYKSRIRFCFQRFRL